MASSINSKWAAISRLPAFRLPTQRFIGTTSSGEPQVQSQLMSALHEQVRQQVKKKPAGRG